MKGLGYSEVLLLLVCVLYLSFQYDLVSQFKQLPSPLFGGDIYYQLGSVNHIRYGGNPFRSSNILDGEAFYLPFYGSLVAVFAIIGNIDSITAMNFFSLIAMLLGLIVFYVLSTELLKDRYLALISTIIFLPLNTYPILKGTEFSVYIMVPLFILFLWRFMKKESVSSSIPLGIIIGLTSLTHGTAFISIFLMFFVICAYEFIIRFLNFNIVTSDTDNIKLKPSFDREHFKENARKKLRLYLLIFLIGFSISLLTWFNPIFKYHAKQAGLFIEWNYNDYTTPEHYWGYAIDWIKALFFSFNSIQNSFRSLLVISAIVLVIRERDRANSPEFKFILLWITAGLIGTFHYMITIHLLNTHFFPSYLYRFLLAPSVIILAIYSLTWVYPRFSNKLKVFISITIILVLLINQINAFDKLRENKWINAGKNPLQDHHLAFQDYAIKNTDIDDVFLSSNELGFALNGLTGRKLFVTRRAQNSPFLNMEERQLAAAIILYGDNTEEKKDLIKKYKIKYLYWDYYWIQSEYYFDEQGRVTGWFDPILLFDTPDNMKILDEYNISYVQLNTWVDPALKGDKFKKFDLLFISPQNYRSFDRPWKPDLDEYLEEIWSYNYQGEKIAVLYRIKT